MPRDGEAGIVERFAGEVHAHIPTPGDHYSSATGSAIMTAIYGLSRAHVAAGGRTVVMVSKGTRHDYPVGECVEVDGAMRLPTRAETVVDALSGRLGFIRPFAHRSYLDLCEGVPGGAEWVFAWNAPVAVRRLARAGTGRHRCLCLANELFRTYSDRELQRHVAAADLVVSCSDFTAERLASRAGRYADRIRTVLFGVDPIAFSPPPEPPEGDPVVLFVGRVQPEKGAHSVLEAAAAIRSRARRFRVEIVGSSGFARHAPLTPYEQELRRLAEPLGEAVTFEPFLDRTQVADAYRRATILVVPSICYEAFGLTTLEGMATGLAVIGSHRGGIPEAGGDAIAYFDPDDVSTLADQLVALLEDEGARAELGRRGRARAELLSWPNQYDALRTVLDR